MTTLLQLAVSSFKNIHYLLLGFFSERLTVKARHDISDKLIPSGIFIPPALALCRLPKPANRCYYHYKRGDIDTMHNKLRYPAET